MTNREREVVELLAEGLPQKAVAARLGVSQRAIEDRLARLRRKHGATTTSHLVRLIEGGALPLPKPPREPTYRLRPLKGQRQRRRVPQAVFAAVLVRDGMVCGICGTSTTPETFQFDHIVSVFDGGEHTVENMRVVHATCNWDKEVAERKERTWDGHGYR